MIKVGLQGNKAFEKTIRDMMNAGADTARLFKLIGRRMLKMQRQHFTDRVQSDGTPWPVLSEATVEARRKSRTGTRSPIPLRDTGNLYNSMKTSSGKTYAAVGVPVSVPYAVHHQFGSDDGQHPPKREFLYITKVERKDLVRMLTNPLIANHLKTGVKRATGPVTGLI